MLVWYSSVKIVNRWVVLSSSFLAFMLSAYAFQLVSPLLNELQAVFGIDLVVLGLLISLAVIPGIFLALPGGVLIDKYGFQKIGTVSSILVAIGSISTALAPTFMVALAGRLILGVGACLLTIGTPALISQWFNGKESGKAMGIYAVGSPVGAAVAFFSTPLLAQSFGWQFPFFVEALASTVIAGLFFATVREGPLKSEQTCESCGIRRGLFNRNILGVSLVWMLFNMAVMSFLTWAPTLFTQFKGVSMVDASFLSSIFVVVSIVLVPVFGWASDLLGRRSIFVVTGSIIMALSLTAISYVQGLSLVASILIFSAAAGAIPSIVMAMTVKVCPPKRTASGFGVITIWQNLGVTVTAPFIGYFIQSTQSISSTLLVISSFTVAATLVTLVMRTK